MLHHNYSLKSLNTFGLDVKTSQLLEIKDAADYLKFLETHPHPTKPLILGGGSNLLFLNDYNGLVIRPVKNEITEVKKTTTTVLVEATAAVVWDELVAWSVEKGYGGLENLTDIPGCVGASPVQNIGAYGAEAKDTIVAVKGFYLDNGSTFEMNNAQCRFAYRDSIFKQELSNKALITSVVFQLSIHPTFHLSYGNLAETVERKGPVSLKHIREAVREIRASKLPAVEELGNAGSFFKNPVISTQQYETLKATYPQIPGYTVSKTETKVPAAWLIDQCGLKGKTLGKAQVFPTQPLVLVNTGGATGNDIFNLAQQVISAVTTKFSILLQPEVNIIS